MLGPERGRGGQRAKKPGMPRRASSNVQAPHRGQEFSVDDDVTEMEGDLASTRQSSTSGFGSARHQSSTLRRRTGPPQPPLPRVDSSRSAEEGAEADADGMSATADAREEPAPDSGDEGTIGV